MNPKKEVSCKETVDGLKYSENGYVMSKTLLVKTLIPNPNFLAQSSTQTHTRPLTLTKRARTRSKFAFDKVMDSEIPESIADFIEGRVPKRIGAKHYVALPRQSSEYYSKYAKHIQTLRKKREDLWFSVSGPRS